MTPSKLMVLIAAPVLMVGACIGVTGIEAWLAGFGTTPQAQQTLGRIGLALPYVIAAAIGVIFLFAARGAVAICAAGLGVLIGAVGVIAIAALREFQRLAGFHDAVPDGQPHIANVGIVANALQAIGGPAADPPGRGAAHAR